MSETRYNPTPSFYARLEGETGPPRFFTESDWPEVCREFNIQAAPGQPVESILQAVTHRLWILDASGARIGQIVRIPAYCTWSPETIAALGLDPALAEKPELDDDALRAAQEAWLAEAQAAEDRVAEASVAESLQPRAHGSDKPPTFYIQRADPNVPLWYFNEDTWHDTCKRLGIRDDRVDLDDIADYAHIWSDDSADAVRTGWIVRIPTASDGSSPDSQGGGGAEYPEAPAAPQASREADARG